MVQSRGGDEIHPVEEELLLRSKYEESTTLDNYSNFYPATCLYEDLRVPTGNLILEGETIIPRRNIPVMRAYWRLCAL